MVGGEAWGEGGTPNYGCGVYGYRYNRKYYSFPPNQKGDNAPLIGTQTTDIPEGGAQEPQLRRTGRTVGKDSGGGHRKIDRGR